MQNYTSSFDTFDKRQGGLTVTAPEGAICGLYPNVPKSTNYYDCIDPKSALEPTSVTTSDGLAIYYYRDLDEGIYHFGASMEGYNAVCQIINYTREKSISGVRVDMKLDKMAGNGYEEGYVMLYSQEFIDAHLASEKNTWGEEYVHLFNTPQFLRPEDRPGKHQQTTNEELFDFINKLNDTCENMYIFSLGKSPKYKYDMPLVLFTHENLANKTLEQAAEIIRNNGKPTIQHTAQVHSNESVSAEGALAMMLELAGEYGERVLNYVDVYIVPRINLDGAVETIRQSPTTAEDMNRDYLRMNNQEIRMVTSAYNLFLPEVAIDAHEKRTNFLTTGESRCTDMELQVGAGSLNHPAYMTEMAMDIALAALTRARELGLRGHFYTYLASAAGGSAGSSYYGTRNSLSFLVETPGGSSLGMAFMERRVMAQYVFASSAINYTVENAAEVMKTVHLSRQKMIENGSIYDENNLMVLEHEKKETGTFPTHIINVPTGQITNPDFDMAYSEHVVALRTRVRPTAYVIPKGIANEKTILQVAECHAIKYYEVPPKNSIQLRQYIKSNSEIELSDEVSVCFDNGAYVFPNTVPSTILSVVMEPDFNTASGRKMSLLSMGLIDADANGRLPIYRYCHNLINGNITLNS